MTATDLKNAQKIRGFAPTPYGIWADAELVAALNLPCSLVLDWPHCTLQEGVLSQALPLYCQELGEKREQFNSFLEGWTAGNAQKATSLNKLQQIVTSGSASGHDRPSCSEYLSFVAVLRCWLVFSEDNSNRGIVLRYLCEFIAHIQCAKYDEAGPESHAGRLRSSWERWYGAEIALLGDSLAKPKSHWLMHLKDSLGILMDSFIVERLHRRAKLFSKMVPNNPKFEATILQRIFVYHAKSLDCADVIFGGDDSEAGALRRNCVVNGQDFKAGMFVYCSDVIGRIIGCSRESGEAWLYVQLCGAPTRSELRRHEEFFNFVSLKPDAAAKWKAASCRAAIAWKACGVDTLILH